MSSLTPIPAQVELKEIDPAVLEERSLHAQLVAAKGFEYYRQAIKEIFNVAQRHQYTSPKARFSAIEEVLRDAALSVRDWVRIFAMLKDKNQLQVKPGSHAFFQVSQTAETLPARIFFKAFRERAYLALEKEVAECTRIKDKLELLEAQRREDLFAKHRDNHWWSFGRTSTVIKIDALKESIEKNLPKGFVR